MFADIISQYFEKATKNLSKYRKIFEVTQKVRQNAGAGIVQAAKAVCRPEKQQDLSTVLLYSGPVLFWQPEKDSNYKTAVFIR